MPLAALYRGFGDHADSTIRLPTADGEDGSVDADARDTLALPQQLSEQEQPMWSALVGFEHNNTRFCDIVGPPGRSESQSQSGELSIDKDTLDDAALQNYLLGQAAELGVSDRLFKCRFKDRYVKDMTDLVEYIEGDARCARKNPRGGWIWRGAR